MRRLRARLGNGDREAGLTLVELLVAASMSVVLVGAAGAMLISAVRDQPKLSKKAQDISTARYVLERMTREIRNGIAVIPGATGSGATGSRVEFETLLRRAKCGGAVQTNAAIGAIPCLVTYSCTTTACTRTETAPGASAATATPQVLIDGLDSNKVFNYEPSREDP
ncbi:MAG TPA: hypothetical protein VF085_12615, partial [Solirubrobacterales bacterium]